MKIKVLNFTIKMIDFIICSRQNLNKERKSVSVKVCRFFSQLCGKNVRTFGYARSLQEFPVRGACAAERSRSGRIVAQKYMLYSPRSCFDHPVNSA